MKTLWLTPEEPDEPCPPDALPAERAKPAVAATSGSHWRSMTQNQAKKAVAGGLDSHGTPVSTLSTHVVSGPHGEDQHPNLTWPRKAVPGTVSSVQPY